MSEIHFHETLMGAKFYRQTMPGVLEQLERIADALERIAGQEATPEARDEGASRGGDDTPVVPDSGEEEPGPRNL